VANVENNADSDTEFPGGAHLLVFCTPEIHEQHTGWWEKLRLQFEDLEVKLLADNALPLLATSIVKQPGVNLLQGRYIKQSDLLAFWPIWRMAAILLVGLAIVSSVFKVSQLTQLESAEARLDEAAIQILQATFPGASGAGDPWGQLQSQLTAAQRASGGNGAGFSSALEALAAAISKTQGISVDMLSYRSGIIDLRVRAASVDQLASVSDSISKSGRFTAEIQSANPKDDVIEGRIQIKAVAGT